MNLKIKLYIPGETGCIVFNRDCVFELMDIIYIDNEIYYVEKIRTDFEKVHYIKNIWLCGKIKYEKKQ